MTTVAEIVRVCTGMPNGGEGCGGGGVQPGGGGPGFFKFTDNIYTEGTVDVERVGGTRGTQRVDVTDANGAIIETLVFLDGEGGTKTVAIPADGIVYLANPRPSATISEIVSADVTGAGTLQTVQWTDAVQDFDAAPEATIQLLATRSSSNGALNIPINIQQSSSPGEDFIGELVFLDGSFDGVVDYVLPSGGFPISYSTIIPGGEGYVVGEPSELTGEITEVIEASVVNFVSDILSGVSALYCAQCSLVRAVRSAGSGGAIAVPVQLLPAGGGEPIPLGAFEWADGESGEKTLDVCLLTGEEATGTLEFYDVPEGVTIANTPPFGDTPQLALIWQEVRVHWQATDSASSYYGPDAGDPPNWIATSDMRRIYRRYEGVSSFWDVNNSDGNLTVPVKITVMDPENFALPIDIAAEFTPTGDFGAGWTMAAKWTIPMDQTDTFFMTWEIQPSPEYVIGTELYPNVTLEVQALYQGPPVELISWEAGSAHPEATLSMSNHRAYFAMNEMGNIRSTVDLPDEPVYFEVLCDIKGSAEAPHIGIDYKFAVNTAAIPGPNFYGVAVQSGRVYQQALEVAQYDEFVEGDVICFAFRPEAFPVAGRMWIRRNGEAWLGGGDPVADTDPTLTLDTPSSPPFRIFASSFNEGVVWLNNDLQYGKPAGFSVVQNEGA